MFQLPKTCYIGLALSALATPASASEMFASDSPWTVSYTHLTLPTTPYV